MAKGQHLPIYGIGPICVASMIVEFLIFAYLDFKGYLDSANLNSFSFIFYILGSIFIVLGIYMWISAVLISKIDNSIINNHLLTDGIYSYLRNPIYTAFAFLLFGLSLFFKNLWAISLIPTFWFTMTILIKNTEEKWLIKEFGDEYLKYCKKVNRIFPTLKKPKV